jgi:hypothetical protein
MPTECALVTTQRTRNLYGSSLALAIAVSKRVASSHTSSKSCCAISFVGVITGSVLAVSLEARSAIAAMTRV